MILLRSSKVHQPLQLRARQYVNVATSMPIVAQLHHFAQILRPEHVAMGPVSPQVKPESVIMSMVHPFTMTTSTTAAISKIKCTAPRRSFTTAYQGTPGDGKHNHRLLTHLIPHKTTLKDGRHVEVDFFRHSPTDTEEDEYFAGMALMNLVIREGRSWPFEEEFTSLEDWSGYFLSHTAFVVRALDNGMDAARRNSSSQGEILGCFYIKPNFPG